MKTKLLPTNVLNAVKRTRMVYQVGRKARFAFGSYMGARYVPALDSRAHYNDFMLSSTSADHLRSYRQGAVDFVGILERSLQEAGRDWQGIEACLEVGCGYGRIVRELRHKLPAQAMSVCDVIDEGARFTAAEFGVRRVPVVDAMGEEYDETFDLIYLLSVYTHLPRLMIEDNLARVSKLLKPEGVLVFSTHGKQSAEKAEIYEQYWLDKEKLNAELDRTGFFYERYPYYYAEYGLTWIVADEVKKLVAAAAPGLEFIAHHALALDGHQDVFVYRRA
ncbi:MAG: class I SAM-dependent methyltransferase [Methylobacteriaceae bacterium]|nr:class I SAM-dependent methyltransferase [Methylobacteriaceae bacterium]